MGLQKTTRKNQSQRGATHVCLDEWRGLARPIAPQHNRNAQEYGQLAQFSGLPRRERAEAFGWELASVGAHKECQSLLLGT